MDANPPRLIDAYLPSHRTRPMEVLCLGQSRTGTFAIKSALDQLGIPCWHMHENMSEPRKYLNLWTEAVMLRLNENPSSRWVLASHGREQPEKLPSTQGRPWGREEFDAIFADWAAVADVPVCDFVDEMLAAYPDAKVVLTTRDADGWLRSMSNTVEVVMSWRSWDWVAPWDKSVAGPWWSFARVMSGGSRFAADDKLREAYLAHNEHVRTLVPKERLLEFHASHGWEPLCKFLGKDVPTGPFPNVNDSANFVSLHSLMWYMALGKMALKVGSVVIVPAAVGWYYWRHW